MGEFNEDKARNEESRRLGGKRWRRRCIEKTRPLQIGVGSWILILIYTARDISTRCEVAVDHDAKLKNSSKSSNPCCLYSLSMATTQVSSFFCLSMLSSSFLFQHYLWASGHFLLLLSSLRYFVAWLTFKHPSAWSYKGESSLVVRSPMFILLVRSKFHWCSHQLRHCLPVSYLLLVTCRCLTPPPGLRKSLGVSILKYDGLSSHPCYRSPNLMLHMLNVLYSTRCDESLNR